MTKNILVVDDDVQIGNLLEEVLGREGYAVWRAYSGTEALLLLGAKRPDEADRFAGAGLFIGFAAMLLTVAFGLFSAQRRM